MNAGRYTVIKNFNQKSAGPGGRRAGAIPFLRRILRKYMLGRSGRGFPVLYYLSRGSGIIYEYRYGPAGAGFPRAYGAFMGELLKSSDINSFKNHIARSSLVHDYNQLQPVSISKTGVNLTNSFYRAWGAGSALPAGVMAVSAPQAFAPGFAVWSKPGKFPAAFEGLDSRNALSGSGVLNRHLLYKRNVAQNFYSMDNYLNPWVLNGRKHRQGFVIPYTEQEHPSTVRKTAGAADLKTFSKKAIPILKTSIRLTDRSPKNVGANSFAQSYISSNKFGDRAPGVIKIASTSLKFSSSKGAVSSAWKWAVAIHHTKEPLLPAGKVLARSFHGISPSGDRRQVMENMKRSQPIAHLRHSLPGTAAVEHSSANNPVAARAGFYGTVLQPQKRGSLMTAKKHISLPSYTDSVQIFYPPVRLDVPKEQHTAKERDHAAGVRPRQVSKDGAADRPEEFLRVNDNRLHRLDTREELNHVADRVYSLIERRIRIERERRGKPCW